MRRFGILLGTALAVATLLTAASGGEPNAKPIDLLDPAPSAGNMGHWKFYSEDPNAGFADTWRVDDGVLVCRGTPPGYLYTGKQYGNFVLSLQYRIPRNAKPQRGGVLIRMTGKHRVWPKSLEAQINHPDAGDFWGLVGFQLDGPGERKKHVDHANFGPLTHLSRAHDAAHPPGEWNDYEIRAEGGTVTLLLNGRLVNQATGCDVAAGPILLTAEGNEIHFRNIKLLTRDKDPSRPSATPQ